MSERKEPESKVLTREEMKNTKGGAIAAPIGVAKDPLRIKETAEPLAESANVSAAVRGKKR
jgi:hypothetical protein